MDDTHPDARRVQIELLRKMGPERRAAIALGLSDSVVKMSQSGIARARPHMTDVERAILFVESTYGRALGIGLAQRLKSRFVK